MAKKGNESRLKAAIERTSSLEAAREPALETLVSESDYPFCALPAFFFDRALHSKGSVSAASPSSPEFSSSSHWSSPRTLLSVQTWDGRDVLEVEGV